MTNFNINYPVVKKVGPEIENIGDEYIQKINKMYDAISKLESSWLGADSATYIAEARNQEKDLKALGLAVKDYGTLLKKLVSLYEEGEDSAASAARKMFSNK